MGVISRLLLGPMLVAVACAEADQRPASSSQGGMTLGQGEETEADSTPTTTVPTTGISAGADDRDDGSATSADGDSTSTGESTTSMESESTTSASTSETSRTSSDDASTGEATSDSTTGGAEAGGETTGGETTDAETSAGGCNHPPGTYGDCLNVGFSACMNPDSVCIHDDVGTPTVGVCSLVDCVDTCDCPQAPPTGNAQVVCSPILPNDETACILACGQATICPTGMTCWANTLCVFQ